MTEKDDTYKRPDSSPVLPDAFDCRIRLRSLTRGEITQADLKKYHDALPDDAANADFRDYDQLMSQEGADGTSLDSEESTERVLTTH
jgi:hypothetical protein